MLAFWATVQGPPFTGQPLPVVITEGPDFSKSQEWWEDLLWSLEQRDLAPDWVAMDIEGGVGYWQLGQEAERTAALASLWADDASRAALSPELVQHGPGAPGWMQWSADREGVILFDQFAAEVRNQALQKSFRDPLHQRFPAATISNYNDQLDDGLSKDGNGWPLPQVMLGQVASPPLYAKNAETNLERVRQILATGTPVAPWVSHPSYIGRDVWKATVEGAYRLGVRDFLYWNPDAMGKTEEDDEFAAGVFADLLNAEQRTSFD